MNRLIFKILKSTKKNLIHHHDFTSRSLILSCSQLFNHNDHHVCHPRYFGQSNHLIHRPRTDGIHRSSANIVLRSYQAQTSSGSASPDETIEDAVQQFRLEHQVFINNVHDHQQCGKNIFDFDELEMPEKLSELLRKIGYTKPTPIQAQALPILFAGMDLIGIAQTGSGKTLAYLLPAFRKYFHIHQDYLKPPTENLNPRVLILAPTRELAVQIHDVVRKFRIFKSICLYGGNDRKKQIHFLDNNNPLILVSTPGRLKDLVDDHCVDLGQIDYLVVDEADRMLDMGFEPQISYLINQCPDRFQRQTMMFSASWPEEVRTLVDKYLKPDHAFISIGGTKLVANHNIEQKIIVCDHHERLDHLFQILKEEDHPKTRTLIFCNTKRDCDRIASMIHRKCRISSAALHGDLTQRQRETTLKDFKSGLINVLCATNVAARGLDIDDVNMVINYDFPGDIETYVHRIGRTGRKDNKGMAVSFFTDQSNPQMARKLMEILEESNNEVPEQLKRILQNRHVPPPPRRPRYPTKKTNNYYNNNNYYRRY